MTSTAMFGLASSKIGKQWHCNSCNSDCYRNRLHWLQFGLFSRRGHIWQTVGTDTACTTVEFSFNGCAET